MDELIQEQGLALREIQETYAEQINEKSMALSLLHGQIIGVFMELKKELGEFDEKYDLPQDLSNRLYRLQEPIGMLRFVSSEAYSDMNDVKLDLLKLRVK